MLVYAQAILAQLSAIVSAGGTNGKKLQTNLIVNLINEVLYRRIAAPVLLAHLTRTCAVQLITSFTLDESNLKLVLNLFRLASKNGTLLLCCSCITGAVSERPDVVVPSTDAAHAGLAAAVALVKSRAATAANDPRAIPGRPSRWESLVPLASALSRKRVGAR